MQNSDTANHIAKRYPWILVMLTLPFLWITFFESIRCRSYRYLVQRLGFAHTRYQSRPLWIHATSVGEVLAARPLVLEIRQRYPDLDIVLTTTTPTGAAIANRDLGEMITHQYLPLDWKFSVKRFLKRINPRAALIMETEIWPNLFRTCHQMQIPLQIINGRLSEKTLHSKTWLRPLLAESVNYCEKILARSDVDRETFERLGTDPDRVTTFGNIKFATSDISQPQPIDSPFSRPYVLAASTHNTEEILLARVWQEIDHKNTVLAIAPRHPKRLSQILAQLEPLGLIIAVRSRGDKIDAQTQVYIVDTIGELTGFMPGSQLVFMGGSFISPGGHNFLEPAHMGKAIIFGPNMQLVSEAAETFLDRNAVIQVRNETDLGAALERLLDDEDERDALGKRAQQIIAENADIARRYADSLKSIIENPG